MNDAKWWKTIGCSKGSETALGTGGRHRGGGDKVMGRCMSTVTILTCMPWETRASETKWLKGFTEA